VADLGADGLGDRAEVLDLVARAPVRTPCVDVDHDAALVSDPPRLGGVLGRRVRDRRALVAIGQRPGDRAGDDDGVCEAQGGALRGKWEVLLPTMIAEDAEIKRLGRGYLWI